MKELQELIKYLKDNGYAHLKINPDLLIGIIEYFASKQEPKQCTITDVSQQREQLSNFLNDTSHEDIELLSTKEIVDNYLVKLNCG